MSTRLQSRFAILTDEVRGTGVSLNLRGTQFPAEYTRFRAFHLSHRSDARVADAPIGRPGWEVFGSSRTLTTDPPR